MIGVSVRTSKGMNGFGISFMQSILLETDNKMVDKPVHQLHSRLTKKHSFAMSKRTTYVGGVAVTGWLAEVYAFPMPRALNNFLGSSCMLSVYH